MSSLAVSLLLLVVLAVAIAVVYNLRQARPQRRWREALRTGSAATTAGSAASAAEAAPGAQPRGEPRLDARDARDGEGGDGRDDAADLDEDLYGAAPEGARDGLARGAVEGDADEPGGDGQPGVAPPAAGEDADAIAPARDGALQPALSPVYDCVVALELPQPLPGARLLALVQRFRRAGGKPVAADGLAVDAGPDDWTVLAAARPYRALRIGVLMANRHGALNAMEFSEFAAGVQEIAEALAVLADLPDMARVLARAREIDTDCAQLDAQVGVNVEAPDALGPAQLAALAPGMSVVERGSDRYARLGPNGELLFSVALGDVPGRLTFLLDVPRAPAASGSWERMVETARACALRLGGRLVDDGGKPLADAALAQIGRQVAQRQEKLEEAGLAAGSPLALRVFN